MTSNSVTLFDALEELISLEPQEARTFDCAEYIQRGQSLSRKSNNDHWAVGDWLLEGEPFSCNLVEPICRGTQVYDGNFYAWASDITGIPKQQLYDLASTARRCPPSVRTEKLTWHYHRIAVNYLPKELPEDAKVEAVGRWLTRAIEEKWTIRQLQKVMRGQRVKEPSVEKSFKLTVPLSVWEALKTLGDARQVPPQQIAREWLLERSASDETQHEVETAAAEVADRRHQKRAAVGRRVAKEYDSLGIKAGRADWQV